MVNQILLVGRVEGSGLRRKVVDQHIMRGFGGADITEPAREVVLRSLDGLSAEEKADYGMVKEKVRVELKRYIQKATGRRPMIMPVVMEI